MSFEERADAVIAALDREELKLVYRILHQHLASARRTAASRPIEAGS